MIARLVLAIVIAVLAGLGFVALLGPVLISLHVPIAVIFGDFFVAWGWVLGLCLGLWYFFAGSSWWPRSAA